MSAGGVRDDLTGSVETRIHAAEPHGDLVLGEGAVVTLGDGPLPAKSHRRAIRKGTAQVGDERVRWVGVRRYAGPGGHAVLLADVLWSPWGHGGRAWPRCGNGSRRQSQPDRKHVDHQLIEHLIGRVLDHDRMHRRPPPSAQLTKHRGCRSAGTAPRCRHQHHGRTVPAQVSRLLRISEQLQVSRLVGVHRVLHVSRPVLPRRPPRPWHGGAAHEKEPRSVRIGAAPITPLRAMSSTRRTPSPA